MPKEDVSLELAMIVEYLQKNWSNITTGEFEYAWLLSVNGKLEDCEFYGNFSPMYVSKVLNSYLYYRKQTLSQLIIRKDKDEYEKSIVKPTPEERAELMKDNIRSIYKHLLEDDEVFDPFNLLYNFFRKHKWLKVSQKDIDEAMSVATNKYYTRKQKTALIKLEPNRSREDAIKSIARNYLVEKYLKKTEIDMLLNNINSELFTNLE
jgi:hypothetical protein